MDNLQRRGGGLVRGGEIDYVKVGGRRRRGGEVIRQTAPCGADVPVTPHRRPQRPHRRRNVDACRRAVTASAHHRGVGRHKTEPFN